MTGRRGNHANDRRYPVAAAIPTPNLLPVTQPTDTDTYFICAPPRTGSSLLLGLLDSTGVAGHPQAYFRTPDEGSWTER